MNRSVDQVMTFILVKYDIKLSVVVTTVADVVDLTVALLQSISNVMDAGNECLYYVRILTSNYLILIFKYKHSTCGTLTWSER